MPKTIKWEKLKKDAERTLLADDRLAIGYSQFLQDARMPILQDAIHDPDRRNFSSYQAYERAKLEVAAKRVREIISNWDVRSAGRLIECVPGIVPSKYLSPETAITVEMDDKCEWVVHLKEPAPRYEPSQMKM